VILEIEADANEFANFAHARAEPHTVRDHRQLRDIQRGQLAQARGRQRVAGDVTDHAAQIPNLAGRIQ
jgi:hypothetical protein